MKMRLTNLTFTGLLISSLFSASACAQAQSDPSTEAQSTQSESGENPSAVEPGEERALTPDEEFAQTDPNQTPREPSDEAKAALAMIGTALKKIDEEIEPTGNNWEFQLGEHVVLVVTDPIAERMRIMIPIAPAELLSTELLQRLMQANFDSALDARYGVAQNLLWGTFIHPLTKLDEAEFLSGLSQTVAIADNFGTTFSSGAAVFGGGDSQAIIENQLEELIRQREKANSI